MQQQAIDDAIVASRLDECNRAKTKVEPAPVDVTPVPGPPEPQLLLPRREPKLAGVNPDGSPRWE